MESKLKEQSLIFERALLIKLFHNKDLQDKYLPSILPGLWGDPNKRFLIYCFHVLHENNIEITLDNLSMILTNAKVMRFAKKQNISILSSEEMSDILYEVGVSSDPSLFREGYEELHNLAFCRSSERINKDITYEIAYKNPSNILSCAKAINNIYKIIFKHKHEEKLITIDSMVEDINEANETLKMFSNTLNKIIIGTSRGWAATLLGRSGHTKSTFMTFDSIFKILNKTVSQVDIITVEERPHDYYRRIFAYIFNIPISHLRDKKVKLTKAQVDKIKSLFENRINVHNITTLREFTELLFTLKSEFIWVDHINALRYPGQGSAMMNMIGGIPSLISNEVEYLNTHKETSIVNLSQVNEKELAKLGGIWRHPSYIHAYGSQVLHQHSREYLTIYYPYKDMVNNPKAWTGKRDLIAKAKQTDVYLKVEKSSYGDLAELRFKYNFDFGSFSDYVEDKKDTEQSENLFDEL